MIYLVMPRHATIGRIVATSLMKVVLNTILQVIQILDSNLDPFTTYCQFLTTQATSIDLAPKRDNATMKMLYSLSQIAYAKILEKDARVIEELKNQSNLYCKQFEKILAMLTDDSIPRNTIKEYVSESLQYSIQQKRKLDEITIEDDLSEEQDLDEVVDPLEKYMEFVERFREERSEERKDSVGNTKMEKVL